MVNESIFKTGDICGQSYRIVRLVMRNAWIEKYFVKRQDTQHTAILTCSRFRHIVGDPPSPELFKSMAERIRSAPFIELPKVYDFGVQGEVYWIATQYIDAPSIATLNKQGRPDATPEWRALDAASIASTVSATLGDIVKYDLLHGHLTPEHFVIDGLPFDMNVFLLDAGFADLFQFNGVAARHYLRYCAPELLNGKAVDQRSDIYSLGMVLYHLIAQHPPYWDKIKIDHDPALIPMVLEQAPTDLRELAYCPEPLWDLIVRAIHKDPHRRFQTIDDFYEMVQHAINKIEGEPRIQDFGEQVRREAEAKKTAVVPLITAKPRKEGDGPTTVPPGPNTEMKRRAAWLSALQNAALPRIAPEPSQCAEEPLSAQEPSAKEAERPLFVAAEPSAKAKPKDEAEGPITSRSPTDAREGRENAREAPEASVNAFARAKAREGARVASQCVGMDGAGECDRGFDFWRGVFS